MRVKMHKHGKFNVVNTRIDIIVNVKVVHLLLSQMAPCSTGKEKQKTEVHLHRAGNR